MSVTDTGSSGRDIVVGDVVYDYRRESARRFADAVGDFEDSVGRSGFTVTLVHDLQATLAAKGFEIHPIRIYELGVTDDLASRVLISAGLRADDARVAKLLPCRVNLFVEDDLTVVTALRPTLLARVFPEAELEAPAEVLEQQLLGVVDEVAGRSGG